MRDGRKRPVLEMHSSPRQPARQAGEAPSAMEPRLLVTASVRETSRKRLINILDATLLELLAASPEAPRP
jgi:hypothetical protein